MSTGFYLLDHRQGPDTWYPSRRDPLDVIVMHITAGLEDLDGADASAERTARYAATTTRKVSWHAGVDSDSFLHLLPASYTAWHCQGFNSESYGVEISKATTRWTGMPPAWVDRTLANTAALLAPIVKQYDIPLRRLTRAQVLAGGRGFAAHADLDPERRSDPGADFPWARLFALIAEINNPPSVQEDDDMSFICNDGPRIYLRDGGDTIHVPDIKDVPALLALGVKDARNKLSAEMVRRLVEAAKQ